MISQKNVSFPKTESETHLLKPKLDGILSKQNQPKQNGVKFSISKEEDQKNSEIALQKEKELQDILFPETTEIPELIKKAMQVPQCSILKYGINFPSKEIEYSYCQTCDINLIYPICKTCIEKCHVGHNVKLNYKKGKIKCICGEKLHTFEQSYKNYENKSCSFTEWSIKTGFNIYYKNSSGNPLCIFCHNICSDKTTDYIVHETEPGKILKCSCKNENVHSEFKKLYEKLNLITHNKFDIISSLHPIQILNLLFKSKTCFEEVYANFIETMNNFAESNSNPLAQSIYFVPANFTETLCYQSLKNFTNIIECNKHTGLRYFCKEAEEYFNFEKIKKIFQNEKDSLQSITTVTTNNLAFWSLSQKLLFIFHKIYIGNHTQRMDKYKIHDLENISFFQRYAVFHTNENIFPENCEIVAFLIEKMEKFSTLVFNHLEVYNAITELIAILKRLSEFSLISNGNMIRICAEMERFFPTFSLMRKQHLKSDQFDSVWEKESRLFYIVVKMLRHFILSFNDRLIKNILAKKQKFLNLDNITFGSVEYLFNKTDLGRLISRLAIRIMSILQKYYSEKSKTKPYNKIIRGGMKLMNYVLNNHDSYLLSVNKSMKKAKFYLDLVNMSEENCSYYNMTVTEQKNIENSYRQYFNFEIKVDQLVSNVQNSLNEINGGNNSNGGYEEKKLASIIKSNYYSSISKIFEILYDKLDINVPQHKKLIEDIFTFYNTFIHNSSDNALLVLSYYIIQAIIKAPLEYGVKKFELFYRCVELIHKKDGVIAFPQYIIKQLYEFLIDLKEKNYNSLDQCLSIFLNILDILVIKTKCLNIEIVIFKMQNILMFINDNFSIISNFFKASEKEDHAKEEKLFLSYLSLINSVYDFTEITKKKHMFQIIDLDKIISILKKVQIRLDTRTEMLRFLRKMLVDIEYNEGNNELYSSAFVNCDDKLLFIKASNRISNFQYPTKLLTFYKDMFNISRKGLCINIKSNFPLKSFGVFRYELENFAQIVSSVNTDNKADLEMLKNYFENGIIIPCAMFLKKAFSIVTMCSGAEQLNIFEFIYYFLQVKEEIAKYDIDFWEADDKNRENGEEELDVVSTIKGYNEDYSRINGEFCRNKELKKKTNESLQKLTDARTSKYDFTSLHKVYVREIQSLLKDIPLANIAEEFEEGETIDNLKKLKALEADTYPDLLSKTDSERRLIRAYLIYKIQKLAISDESSCLFDCLPEICLEFETNYRNLLITLLIHSIEKQKQSEETKKFSYFLLFKLLSIQTTDTQADVIKLLGGKESEKLGFMVNFSEQLFKRLTLLFIDYFNPNDKRSNMNYMMTYNLIKIFKFLCEEHNNFFQGRLIKSIGYHYVKNIPEFFSVVTILPHQTQANDDIIKLKKDKSESHEIKFFDFFLHILSKIVLVSEWENIKQSNTEHLNEYLYDLFAAILELLIEIIQGNQPEFLSRIGNTELVEIDNLLYDTSGDISLSSETVKEEANDSFQKFVENVNIVLFKDDVNNELVFQIRNQLMQFFTAILEEKNCNEEVQKFIIKHLHFKKVISSISFILKSYFIQVEHDNITEGDLNIYPDEDNEHKKDSYKAKVSTTQINQLRLIENEYKSIKFNHHLYSYFKHKYFISNDFSNSNEFQLANIFYRYIKLISVQGKSDEATWLINKVTNISESEALKKFGQNSLSNNSPGNKNQIGIIPLNLINENIKNNDEEFVEHFYIIKFFENITQTVEVRTEDKVVMNQTVIFTVLPEMIYLSEGTKVEFDKKVNRNSETTKKNDLLRHIEYFQKEIKFYQKRRGIMTRFFATIDFTYVQIFCYLYSFILNLLMILTLTGDTRTTQEEGSTGNVSEKRLRMLKIRDENTPIIQDQINASIEEWAGYYDKMTYIFVAINGVFIILWVVFRMPLYYRLDKIKFMEKHKLANKSELTLTNKIYIALVETIYVRDYITTLIYMFIVSLIGAILKRGEIAYPFLLLAIIDLSPTLKNIIMSIKAKHLDLLLNVVLAVIVIYIYSNIGFFFFNDNFDVTLDDYEDNYCDSLVFCFLSTIDYGLRNRGGVGDLMTRISFMRNSGRYIGRIIYDVSFFLIIVIIMIDLVFGIIIGSFQELRNDEQKHINDKKNHCFICHINRGKVEKNRQDFTEHREKIHNTWNYVNYMVSIKFANIHDLNAINSYARAKMDSKNISWLPTFRDEVTNDGAAAEDVEEELKVEDENVSKYVVKKS